MREYSGKISLTRNSRGIYCIDTSIGCSSGTMENDRGCYGYCYAAKAAKRYGYDFTKTVLRRFDGRAHEQEIVDKVNKVKLDFIRIGFSGDPSEDWINTLDVIKVLSRANKQIVIITRHWTALTENQLRFLKTINVCINTSVSALDNWRSIENSVEQYKRIKPFCRSIFRIVSCDFNLENETGQRLADIQHELFKNEDTLDTVFRPDKNNPLVVDGVINVKQIQFLGTTVLASKFNPETFFGNCSNCHELCGVSMKNDKHAYLDKRFIPKQLSLFKKCV